MYKVVILILSLVCGVRAGKAVEALPETTVASSFQLYQELGLRGEVNFPAFEQALKGFSRYASGQDRLLVLIDYTKPSTEKRFYILDLLQKKLLLSTYVGIIMPWLFPIGPVRIKVPWDFFVLVIIIWEKMVTLYF